jgi:transcriptional regulator with XRE-family HTH domain
MDVSTTIRKARRKAGMSQVELAARAGTSQATLSAYEAGRKAPTVITLSHLLSAAGFRLSTEPDPKRVRRPSERELEQQGRTLMQVISLAEALPSRHEPTLRYPRLPQPSET